MIAEVCELERGEASAHHGAGGGWTFEPLVYHKSAAEIAALTQVRDPVNV
jgi:hypothetical protein